MFCKVRHPGSCYQESPPFSTHGFHFKLQNRCLSSSHHLHIPASSMEEGQKNISKNYTVHNHLFVTGQNLSFMATSTAKTGKCLYYRQLYAQPQMGDSIIKENMEYRNWEIICSFCCKYQQFWIKHT